MPAQILALLESFENAAEVSASLKFAGHQLLVVNNYRRAMAILSDRKFDLIISDVHLQSGSVFDFLHWVKSNPMIGETHFVLFSSHPTERARLIAESIQMAAHLLGASSYIVMESFDPLLFRQEIELLLNQEVTSKAKQAKTRKLSSKNRLERPGRERQPRAAP
jgi:CheY-like chemotaxis protein